MKSKSFLYLAIGLMLLSVGSMALPYELLGGDSIEWVDVEWGEDDNGSEDDKDDCDKFNEFHKAPSLALLEAYSRDSWALQARRAYASPHLEVTLQPPIPA